MGSILWFFFLLLHFWYIEMQPISMHWFYILKLCEFMYQFSQFFAGVFWIFHVEYHVICKEWSLTSTLAIWILLYIFVVWLLRLGLPKWLNNSSENVQSCHVPDIRGNALNFSPWRMILAVGLSCMAFMILRYIPYIPTFLRILSRIY